MARPKLDGIVNKLKNGKDFKLSRKEYIKITGVDIPQDRNYTEKHSAVARIANEYNYTIEVIPEVIIFKKY